MPMMRVFHGGYCPVADPKIRVGLFHKDFGDGFYCTTICEQAERWSRRHSTPVVSIYDVTIFEGLDVLDFPTMTNAWLDFIVACRRGVAHAHDIVIGAMANDRIYNFVNDFAAGSISREQFWAMMKSKYPTHQIAFCTERSLKCLSFIGSEVCNA